MTAPKLTPDTPATRRAFNRLAREKMKLRLLADIRMDLMVCELEGWDKLEYLDELLALVQELKKGGGGIMLIDFKIHDSKRANEILSAIAAKKREIDDLCFELRKCMAVEMELKKDSHDNGCPENQCDCFK
ncbi:MAG: hypothetical protein UDN34_01480 [Phascolarctobacterium succinatutens]|nr:hypothetical protein [Phascolarctobacterium succinatutens]